MRRPPRSASAPPLAMVGLALGAAGLGFALYVLAVPYRRVTTELKRRSGELRAKQTEASVRARELARVRQDLHHVSGLGGDDRRADLRVLESEVQQRLAAVKATVELEPGRLRVRLPEEALSDARGADFSRAGQEAMQAPGPGARGSGGPGGDRRADGGRAAPALGAGPVPDRGRSVRGARRERAAGDGEAGARAPTMLAVIGTLERPEDAAAAATLEVEVEP